ncbi:MAG: VWA domain-containing protein [Bacteroidales bacterium]|nr:VWA domain-containing protein [Bacteroidales bacterium]
MKKLCFALSFLALVSMWQVKGNGIAFKDSATDTFLDILESKVNVRVTDQVSVTTISQLFLNTSGDSISPRYAFPLPETASATSLRYRVNGTWYEAAIAAEPQDSLNDGGSGTSVPSDLGIYLGNTPLIYDIETAVPANDSLLVELTFVELLPYKLGQVSYLLPFDINTLLEDEYQDCNFHLAIYSQRGINSISLLSPSSGEIVVENYTDSALIDFSFDEKKFYENISMFYELSADELGLFCLSSFMPDSLVPDEYGNGFFTFIVEPEPQPENQIISKYFTLIIDRSGSMTGQKIIDARDAARFIVNNLNDNDYFNIISFSSDITGFRSQHVLNTTTNQNDALAYISSLQAEGSTNISGAFDKAVPQFSAASENTANIIIFLTDGEQTSGITDTDQLIEHIDQLIVNSETNINLFSFGIGSSTNERLLRTISYDNYGLSEFLADSELESIITEYFLLINNPVLLQTSMTFSPDIVTEIYPGQLPNLYIGQQMIVSGRYSESAESVATLAGKAFGIDVEYSYNPNLASEYREEYLFLMKLWAKQKIETLLAEYYKNQYAPSMADPLKEEIINLSISYGVISPFTSYQGYDDGAYDSGFLTALEVLKVDNRFSQNSNSYCTNLKVLGGNLDDAVLVSFEYTCPELKPGRIMITNLAGQVLGLLDIDIRNGDNMLDITELVSGLNPGLYNLSLEIGSEVLSVLFTVY